MSLVMQQQQRQHHQQQPQQPRQVHPSRNAAGTTMWTARTKLSAGSSCISIISSSQSIIIRHSNNCSISGSGSMSSIISRNFSRSISIIGISIIRPKTFGSQENFLPMPE